MQTVFTDFRFLHGCWICCIKDRFVLDADHTIVRLFQEIQAAQKRGFSTSGRTNDGQYLAFFQRKADILQHLCLSKGFA